MSKNNKHAVILAALLHDIGKFKWRASELKAGMDHETYSEEIFNEFIASKKCVEPIKEEVRELIKHHGNPVLTVINRADHLDAGSNRKVDGNSDSRRPLISVLSRVQLDNDKPLPEGVYYYEPGKLNPLDIFPKHSAGISLNTWKSSPPEMIAAHKALFEKFIEELKQIPDSHIEGYIDTLLFIYEKYLCYVTSASYKSIPDISLFDHNKTVAALAACYNESENEKDPFLIIAADISGIQNFIYNEHALEGTDMGGKAKRLRGKSFYLSLLTDTFASYLLNYFEVSRANLLINGGGHFIIIVPNNEENREKFTEGRSNVQKWFYKYFGGEINLVMESITADDSFYKDYPKWHNEITFRLQKGKRQKSINVLDKVFNYNLDENDYNIFKCFLTQSEKDERSSLNSYEKYIYMMNKLFQNIGMMLPKAEFLLEINQGNETVKVDERSTLKVSFSDFGLCWLLVQDEEELRTILEANKQIDLKYVRVYKINDTGEMGFNRAQLSLNVVKSCRFPVSFGFRFIGRSAPKDENRNILEFEKLSYLNTEDDKILEYDVLGILRMDVDNLGAIFSLGLKRDEADQSIESLSRVVNLSRDLNLFFLGYLNKLADERKVYITYSGGDDLFVVGSWINIINFAFDVKKHFTLYACGNPSVTISGGVYLSKPGFPIGKSAKFAGEKESLAKLRKDKNSISIFERELSWDDMEELLNYAREIDSLVGGENGDDEIKSSYIHFLLTQTTGTLNDDGSLNIEKYFSKISKIKYSLARRKINDKNIREKPDNRKVILLSKLINGDREKYFEKFIVPASYVIIKNRKSKN